MKKFFKTSILIAGMAVAAFASTAVTAKTVRIATDSPYKPMEFTLPDGTFSGFDIDLGNALCKEAGLKCVWQDQEWNGIIPGLLAHKYDAIMSSMTINDKRRKSVLFSDPYIVVASAFFVKKDSPLKEINKKTLKGKKIGVQRGTIQDDYVTDTYGDVADIKRYPNADNVTVDMIVGRLDAAFFDEITGVSALQDAHPGEFREAGKKLTTPKKYFGEGFGLAFRKNETDLAKKFNKALKAVKANGTYDKIYNKYFGSK